jgi:hypothetical protein
MTASLIPGLAEVVACLGTSWVVARWVDRVYRGNEPSADTRRRVGRS